MDKHSEHYLTPCYVIYQDRFLRNYLDIRDNFQKAWQRDVICGYSYKTNNNDTMLSLAKQYGLYAEVVSAKEYRQAKEAGFPDAHIIFNGPNKGQAVYEAYSGGALIHMDSLCELRTFTETYLEQFGKYPEKLGLRINFDLEACVPGQTSTGMEEGRFGICYENGDAENAIRFLQERKISLNSLHIHYTTKTRSLDVYLAIAEMMRNLMERFDLHPDYIDLGGGFWGGRKLEGKPTMEQYAKAICDVFPKESRPTLILEPGSALCSTVAEYWSKAVSVKDIRGTRFVVLDGSVLHINPFMVDRNAQCHWDPAGGNGADDYLEKQVLCGSTCLEKDRFAVIRNARKIEPGTVVVFENAGAYTMSFVSDFILERPHVYLERSSCHE